MGPGIVGFTDFFKQASTPLTKCLSNAWGWHLVLQVACLYVGSKLTVKADASSVIIYDQFREVAQCLRSWQRGQTLGAERFEKELFAQIAAAERSAAQQRLIVLLGPAAEQYLRRLADTDRSLTRQVRELLH